MIIDFADAHESLFLSLRLSSVIREIFCHGVILLPKSTMNTRPAIDESAGPVSLSVAFNQDSSCFSVGLDSGFCGNRSFHITTEHALKLSNIS